MTFYYQSNGVRVAKTTIDQRVRKAKAKKLEDMRTDQGYIACEDCGTNQGYLDCSHDVSVDTCQKTRRCELAWDVNSITIRCRSCHQKYDSKSKL